MRKFSVALLVSALLAEPAQAASWNQAAGQVRPGSFIGARLRISLGGDVASKPQAALTIAPTQSRFSGSGQISTRIGDGVALNFSATRPTLTIGPVRPHALLGLQNQGQVDANRKLGISTVGWVAVGVGTIALAVGGYYIYWTNQCDECDD